MDAGIIQVSPFIATTLYKLTLKSTFLSFTMMPCASRSLGQTLRRFAVRMTDCRTVTTRNLDFLYRRLGLPYPGERTATGRGPGLASRMAQTSLLYRCQEN